MAQKVFHSVSEVKARLNISTIDIVRNPTSGKLFAATTVGNLKVEATFDPHLPIRFMHDSAEDFMEGCFVNVKPLTPPLATL